MCDVKTMEYISAFFDELGAALGAGDGNFTAPFGYADLLVTMRAGKIAVGFAQGKALLELRKFRTHTGSLLQKCGIFGIALVDVTAEHTVIGIDQQDKPDVIKNTYKHTNDKANQCGYAQKIAKGITSVPPGHKTLEPSFHD